MVYRCEIDLDGDERWLLQAIPAESKWIPQAQAARLLGVSRETIRHAIASRRLVIADCNGRPRVCRTDVLALKVRLKLARGEQRAGADTRQRECGQPLAKLHLVDGQGLLVASNNWQSRF